MPTKITKTGVSKREREKEREREREKEKKEQTLLDFDELSWCCVGLVLPLGT
ncbi:uncharacterized protein Dwil_GK28101 [Drosophila willistoni]|uniref:Uncharacterized protein n=1 Tax=Drosophila willistoni TaxID=7260 RepID=A0A0Q9WSI8_DROWI|nr:uncharacterized protein Dwil_GK28101 [Drosophila willistoni]